MSRAKLKITLICVILLAITVGCYICHSSKLKTPMGGLVLDTTPGLVRGRASGPIIVPGKPHESLLIRALRYNDLRLTMPPTGKLSDSIISDFEQWIAAGCRSAQNSSQFASTV